MECTSTVTLKVGWLFCWLDGWFSGGLQCWFHVRISVSDSTQDVMAYLSKVFAFTAICNRMEHKDSSSAKTALETTVTPKCVIQESACCSLFRQRSPCLSRMKLHSGGERLPGHLDTQ